MFVVFEGVEGCGKTTLIKAVLDGIISTYSDLAIVSTREPGGSTKAEKLREEFLKTLDNDPKNTKKILTLILKARKHHLDDIVIPSLAEGKIVLCDRYRLSTLVYQGDLGGLDKKTIERYEKDILGDNFALPDITFLLVGDVNKLRERALNREDKKSAFDMKPADFYQKIQDAFVNRAKNTSNIVTLDAMQPIANNCNIVVKKIAEANNLKNRI